MAHEVVGVVGDDEFFVRDAGFLKTSDEVGGLVEADVAVVVAVD